LISIGLELLNVFKAKLRNDYFNKLNIFNNNELKNLL
jgi:hypothetical protein